MSSPLPRQSRQTGARVSEKPAASTLTRVALERLQQEGKSLLETVSPVDSKIDALIPFLEILTDPCAMDRDCPAPWIPEGTGPDGLEQIGVDQTWEPL